MNNFITELLRLKEPNLVIEEKTDEKEIKGRIYIMLYGVLSSKADKCQHCGITNHQRTIIKHGFRVINVKLPRLSGFPCLLELKKQRYLCHNCNRTFVAETSIVDKYCCLSNNLKMFIADKVREVRSIKSVAESCCVSSPTVVRIIKQTVDEIRHKVGSHLPEHIMMDEFKSVKNVDASMSFIYCDSTSHQIIDIVSDRRKFNLKNYFMKFDLYARKRVKTVCIDMYEPYMDLISDVFPNALVIIDRFHIVQAINREINRTRVKVMNQARRNRRPLYNKYKRYWKLLLKPKLNLNAINYKYHRLFKTLITEKDIVSYLLSNDNTLNNTYEIGQELILALKHNDIDLFRSVLYKSRQNHISEGLMRVLRSFMKYLPFICNTLNHPMITNGPIEGINNKIKLLKRNAYGYRNYANFRDRILLMSRLYKLRQRKTPMHEVA
ncbi:ISL3 family transposase [Staphylococcus massiliensis]|uniref:Transposase for ISSha1 n=1 Tax=Staphylococcus massiliensis S46 TaxID=1229783 RepID=K9ACS0_9STAP|nr:ISL3 family transposase [Staphylococcus massiliensis]HAC5789032.1 ISL3 family transposase [Listeria monocytogenes]EKU45018.1 transposase for ISSha1 [Staphylococcus massiliensis S46]MCG3400723.1 ISL3 family transposase [Staphylococcus massiliensis]MCG3413676.1 ISL3 family transposase [Staphylococcus massiliensis]PNZ98381.1 ISL3 family transposase [Staphylococcus massiliensis CCUG 55927]